MCEVSYQYSVPPSISGHTPFKKQTNKPKQNNEKYTLFKLGQILDSPF